MSETQLQTAYRYHVIGYRPKLRGLDQQIAECWLGLNLTWEIIIEKILPPGLVITDGKVYLETFFDRDLWPGSQAHYIDPNYGEVVESL